MNDLATIYSGSFLVKFSVNTVSLLVLLRLVYYRYSPNRDSLFGFFLFGCGVFLVTSLLHNVEISMGFAFGLFAVFSMLRYRTEAISIRDMTYLFLVIVVALMSAVGPVSNTELILLNVAVCLLAAVSETSILAPRISEKKIIYEHIQNAKPERYGLLIQDLCLRTGLDVISADIESLDFLRDTAVIKIYFREKNRNATVGRNNQTQGSNSESNSNYNSSSNSNANSEQSVFAKSVR